MSCEIFDREKCLGCVALEYDVDKVKKQCETYKELMKYENGEQLKLN